MQYLIFLFGTSQLTSAPSARNLGVVIDSDLSYHQHIFKVCRDSYLQIRQIRRIRHSLYLKTAILLGNSLVSSRLDFCNSLFYGLPANSLIRLQQVQNSLARVIMPSCKKFDHVGPIRSGLHWLLVEKVITFKLATLTFKTLKTDQPRYLSELLQWYVPPRSLKSSEKKLLVLPDIRSANGRRSFSYVAPAVWYSLPENIRASETVVVEFRILAG